MAKYSENDVPYTAKSGLRRRSDRKELVHIVIGVLLLVLLLTCATLWEDRPGAHTHTAHAAVRPTPRPLAQTHRPTPVACVSGRTETIIPGQTRTCVAGRWVLDTPSTIRPNQTAPKPAGRVPHR